MRHLGNSIAGLAICGLTTLVASAEPSATPVEVPAPRPADRSGVSVGVRGAWSFPIGSLAKDDSLASNFDGLLPIGFDAGYRFSPEVYVGGYFQYGVGFVSSDACVAPLTACSADDVRFGVNLHWHLRSALGPGFSDLLGPWVGIGTGYEIASTRFQRGSDTSKVSYRGLEFANLQLGADYLGVGSMRIGGFAAFSLGQYARTTVSVPTGPTSHPVSAPALHAWLTLGLRAQYDF